MFRLTGSLAGLLVLSRGYTFPPTRVCPCISPIASAWWAHRRLKVTCGSVDTPGKVAEGGAVLRRPGLEVGGRAVEATRHRSSTQPRRCNAVGWYAYREVDGEVVRTIQADSHVRVVTLDLAGGVTTSWVESSGYANSLTSGKNAANSQPTISKQVLKST